MDPIETSFFGTVESAEGDTVVISDRRRPGRSVTLTTDDPAEVHEWAKYVGEVVTVRIVDIPF